MGISLEEIESLGTDRCDADHMLSPVGRSWEKGWVKGVLGGVGAGDTWDTLGGVLEDTEEPVRPELLQHFRRHLLQSCIQHTADGN